MRRLHTHSNAGSSGRVDGRAAANARSRRRRTRRLLAAAHGRGTRGGARAHHHHHARGRRGQAPRLRRRRALGATRTAIVVLVLVQTGVAALAGVVLGVGGGLAAVHHLTGNLPDPTFTAGVATLAVLIALAGAVPPALAAAHRDPVRILHVP
ncbi:FtsX-like permease family protein [Oerskovia sp. M15]